jgi:hypothetical protein
VKDDRPTQMITIALSLLLLLLLLLLLAGRH